MDKIKLIVSIQIIMFITASLGIAQEWALTFGGNNMDSGYSVHQTADGGFIVAGTTRSFGAGYADIWVIKLRGNGTIDWQKTYGSIGSEEARSIEQTDDNGDGNQDDGYIVAGYTTSFGAGDMDVWILKLNSDGSVAWQKTYGGAGPDEATTIQQTFDNEGNGDGFIVAGSTRNLGNFFEDCWIIKLHADGSKDWENTYGFDGSDKVNSIQQTFDATGKSDGYVVAAWSYSIRPAKADSWIFRLNLDGTIVWQNKFRTTETSYAHDLTYSIQQTFDADDNPSGFIAAGYTKQSGSNDFWIIKLNADGAKGWEKTYGGTIAANDTAYSIQQTQDGGYIVAGNTESFGTGSSDFWILKLNPDGSIGWEKTYGGTSSETAYCIQQTKDGGFIVAGQTDSYGEENFDYWILKLDTNGEIPECSAMTDSNATVANSSARVISTNAIVPSTGIVGDTNIAAQDTIAESSLVCGSIGSACEADSDQDGDVDGADLAEYILDSGSLDLNDFAMEFGKANCS